MSSNSRGVRSESGSSVKDRSGQGLPPKAERRALGKAAARKRAEQRRRREILNQVARVAAPIAVVALIVGAIWLFGGGKGTPSAEPTAAATTSAPAAWTLPAGLDPQLATAPVVTAGTGTLSELKVTTLVQGTGAAVKAGDTITVNYTGVLYPTGEKFDSSWDRGPSPAQFQIGVGQVIKGWDQGLVGVPVGSRVQLDIPVALAYNHEPGQPDGDLRFVVDILSASAS